MKITHCTIDKLIVVPETPKEMADAINCLLGLKAGDDVEAMDYLTGKKTEVVDIAPKKHLDTGGGWERVEYETNFLKPYYEKMKDLVLTPEGFAIDLTSILGGFYHTHIVQSAVADEKGSLHVTGYVFVYPNLNHSASNPLTAEQRAAQAITRHRECVNQSLGKQESQSEYIEAGGGGLYRKNPKFGRAPTPATHALSNDKVWQAMWRVFRERFATPEQINLLDRLHQTSAHVKIDLGPALCHLNWDKSFHIDNCGGTVKFEDFNKGKDIAITWCPGHEPKPVA